MGDGQRLPRAGQGDTGGRPPSAARTDVYSPSRIFSRIDAWQTEEATARDRPGLIASLEVVLLWQTFHDRVRLSDRPLIGLLGEHRFGFTPIALSGPRQDVASETTCMPGSHCVSALVASSRHRVVVGASSRPDAPQRSTRLRQRRVPIFWAVATDNRCLSRRVRRPVFDICDGDWREVFRRGLRR